MRFMMDKFFITPIRALRLTAIVGCLLLMVTVRAQSGPEPRLSARKVVILMIDGFGTDYYRSCTLPNLNRLEKEGGFRSVKSLMPTVTNANNASICTGVFPEVHGITGNSFLDPLSRKEEFMENDSLVLSPTIFELAGAEGIRSKLFSSKKKTTELLKRGTSEAVSPETANAEWIGRIGQPPPIYSREVNYWLLDAALYSMEHDKEIGLFYIHTTDYPMHTWAPEREESIQHLQQLDAYIGKIIQALPDAAIVITADHSVHHKTRCWDLQKALKARGLEIEMALSPERDKYVRHHRGFGGASYVYLKQASDARAARKLLGELTGVDEVLDKKQAVDRFHLMADRIGDLMVLGDLNTVFGDLDQEQENLPADYRSHGSLYEAEVPLFSRNLDTTGAWNAIRYNFQATGLLFNISKQSRAK